MSIRFVLAVVLGFFVANPGHSSVLIEGFESGDLASYTQVGNLTSSVSSLSAHDGLYGLQFGSSAVGGATGWLYRNDPLVQIAQGDVFSTWINLGNSATSRAYFGFGASASGTLSFVLAPNTNQLIIQANNAYGFTNIGTSSQTFSLNSWYRAEVDWKTGGSVVGKLYGSDGTTLLNSVTANSNLFTSGGIAFRGFPLISFDTVELRARSAIIPEPTSIVIYGIGIALASTFNSRRRGIAFQPSSCSQSAATSNRMYG